jgi:hypothetical protein
MAWGWAKYIMAALARGTQKREQAKADHQPILVPPAPAPVKLTPPAKPEPEPAEDLEWYCFIVGRAYHVRARTKSEARAAVKRQLQQHNLGPIPKGTVIGRVVSEQRRDSPAA